MPLQIRNLTSYFGYAETVVGDLEKGHYDTVKIPDSPCHNTGQVIVEPGIDLEKGDKECFKLGGVAALLTTLIMRQFTNPAEEWKKVRHKAMSMEPSELLNIYSAMDEKKEPVVAGENFECALTRYDGKACIYLVIPPDRTIDFTRLKKDLAESKELFRETASPISGARAQPTSRSWFGPYDSAQAKSFQEIMPLMNKFHGLDGIYGRSEPAEDGKQYLTFKRLDVQRILQKEELTLGNGKKSPG